MSEKVYDNFEDELDAIRLSLYEEVKDMTMEERINYFNAQSNRIIKQYGFKVSKLQPVKPMKRERLPLTFAE